MPKKLARTCSQLQRLASYKSHTHITFLVALQLTVLCDELWNLFVYTGKTNFYSVVMLVSYVARGSARLHIGDPIFQRADPIITSNASTLSRLYCFPPTPSRCRRWQRSGSWSYHQPAAPYHTGPVDIIFQSLLRLALRSAKDESWELLGLE